MDKSFWHFGRHGGAELPWPIDEKGEKERYRNDPQGTGKFHCRRHFKGLFAVLDSGAHNGTGVVNCDCSPSAEFLLRKSQPMDGNINKAMALSTNTTARATDMFDGLALITGPTAAMALPPHIAVPELIRYAVSLSTLSSFLPISIPMASVPTTDMIVKSIPSRPEASDSYRFIPKPSPTTEYCRSVLDIFLLTFG